MTTFTPELIPTINEWLSYISIPQLNLNLIDDSLMGRIIKEGYRIDPYQTIKMIQDYYRDNPIMTEQVISKHNLTLILKCNPQSPAS